jgi:hypothetical protein
VGFFVSGHSLLPHLLSPRSWPVHAAEGFQTNEAMAGLASTVTATAHWTLIRWRRVKVQLLGREGPARPSPLEDPICSPDWKIMASRMLSWLC